MNDNASLTYSFVVAGRSSDEAVQTDCSLAFLHSMLPVSDLCVADINNCSVSQLPSLRAIDSILHLNYNSNALLVAARDHLMQLN